MNTKTIYDLIEAELRFATAKYGPFKSAHEGYAILLEEVDEMWDEIKKKQHNRDVLREEAIQVAAMAVRFIMDLT